MSNNQDDDKGYNQNGNGQAQTELDLVELIIRSTLAAVNSTNAIVQVGPFKLNQLEGTLIGPADYMQERGNALFDRIAQGEDELFNNTAHYLPDAVTAIVVRLHLDFSASLTMKHLKVLGKELAMDAENNRAAL